MTFPIKKTLSAGMLTFLRLLLAYSDIVKKIGDAIGNHAVNLFWHCTVE
jgi:hypothetical protein